MVKKRYIVAYDKKLGKRVVHTLSKSNVATSMVTGSKFKYKKSKGRKK